MYARARAEQERERTAAVLYVAESIRLHAQGKCYARSLAELLEPAARDNRSAEEIAADVIEGAGLVVRNNESA